MYQCSNDKVLWRTTPGVSVCPATRSYPAGATCWCLYPHEPVGVTTVLSNTKAFWVQLTLRNLRLGLTCGFAPAIPSEKLQNQPKKETLFYQRCKLPPLCLFIPAFCNQWWMPDSETSHAIVICVHHMIELVSTLKKCHQNLPRLWSENLQDQIGENPWVDDGEIPLVPTFLLSAPAGGGISLPLEGPQSHLKAQSWSSKKTIVFREEWMKNDQQNQWCGQIDHVLIINFDH